MIFRWRLFGWKMKSKFRLKLGQIPDRSQVAHIDFYGEKYGDPSPVLSQFPDKIDYGHLFAYLFRRFGYPNVGWDSYKNLVCYLLTTPLPNLFLRITPYVGGDVDIGFQFIATEDDRKVVRLWEDADRIAWEQRRYDWLEAQGLPDWMPDWIEKCTEAVQRDYGICVKTWRDAIHWAHMYLDYDKEAATNFKQVADFLKSMESFPESMPGIRRRGPAVEEWTSDDPLKPLALAAIETIKDLERPVRVRDCQINAYGSIDGEARELKEPPVAGYPAGWLYNDYFEEMASIGNAASKLGKGNLKRGLKKVLALVGEVTV